MRLPGRSYKSYLTFLVPPILAAWGHFANGWRNAFGILRWRIYQDSGMKDLIEAFHHTIAVAGPVPIPYREILLTARIMDEIFALYGSNKPSSHGVGDGARGVR